MWKINLFFTPRYGDETHNIASYENSIFNPTDGTKLD